MDVLIMSAVCGMAVGRSSIPERRDDPKWPVGILEGRHSYPELQRKASAAGPSKVGWFLCKPLLGIT